MADYFNYSLSFFISMKYWFIYFFITLLFIPTILLTDFFPFMRLGMFAEPVRKAAQVELFYISIKDTSSSFHGLNTELMGVPHSSLDYLARNYFYRNQTEDFLDKLQKKYPIRKATFRFSQIIIPLNKTVGDTTIILEKKYD